MSMTVKEEILGWVKERLEDVEQEGSLAIVGLVHFDSHSRESEIFSMKAGSGNWGKADLMANSLYSYSARHSRGLIGAQQFNLQATYGSSGKPTRFLPFGLPGMLQFGSVAGGGLATEAPSAHGQASQGMRLAELVTQGMIAQINPTFHVQANLIDRLMRRGAELEGENRELFIALRAELEKSVQASHERRMREFEYTRTTEERKRLIKILPALANVMTGKEVFPISAEDTALIEALCENVSEDEVKGLTTMVGQRSPELASLMMARFRDIQKKKDVEAEETRRVAREATGGTYEEAERDAMGRPLREVRETPAEPSGTIVTRASGAQDAMLDTMLAALSDDEIDRVAMLFAVKRPDIPGFADEIKRRYAALKKGKAA